MTATAPGSPGMGATATNGPGSPGMGATTVTATTQGINATRRSGWSTITAPPRKNPYEDLEFAPCQAKNFSLAKTFKVSRYEFTIS